MTWPFVVPLNEIYLFSPDASTIDFSIPVDKKSPQQLETDIAKLLVNAMPINELNEKAQQTDSACPHFPVNGSVSRINKIFEDLILQQPEMFQTQTEETALLEAKLSETFDEQLAKLSKSEILAHALKFDNSAAESHSTSIGPKKVRKESYRQKRRIAALEEYTCQVCGFKYEYTKENGKKGWVITVDHIQEKSIKGSEIITNLWALCPNCHAKKTCGILKINLAEKKVTENGKEIELFCDHHLFVN